MEQRFFVDYKLHNAINNGWAYKTELSTTDYDAALKKYYSVLSQYIGVKDFDHVLVQLIDIYGNSLESKYWQRPVEIQENEDIPVE